MPEQVIWRARQDIVVGISSIKQCQWGFKLPRGGKPGRLTTPTESKHRPPVRSGVVLDDKTDDDHRPKILPVVTEEILDDSWKLLKNAKNQSVSQMRQEIESHPSSKSMENRDISNSRQVPQIRQFIWGTTSGMTMVVPVYMGGRKISALVDTAAQVTLISSKLWGTLQVGFQKTSELMQLSNAEKDSCMEGQLYTHVGFALGGRKYISDVLAANIADDMILGLDFLKSNKCKIDLEDDSLEMANGDKI